MNESSRRDLVNYPQRWTRLSPPPSGSSMWLLYSHCSKSRGAKLVPGFTNVISDGFSENNRINHIDFGHKKLAVSTSMPLIGVGGQKDWGAPSILTPFHLLSQFCSPLCRDYHHQHVITISIIILPHPTHYTFTKMDYVCYLIGVSFTGSKPFCWVPTMYQLLC